MQLLHLLCKACGAAFESGIPLQREHLHGVKLRTLEVCPSCGAAADYSNEDYRVPEEDRPAPEEDWAPDEDRAPDDGAVPRRNPHRNTGKPGEVT